VNGTHVNGVVRIGMDDTDHVDHACTTEQFQRLLSALGREIDHFQVVERRLVRLWPFAPTRTRGNAALSAVCELGVGAGDEGGAALSDVNRICSDFMANLEVEIERDYPTSGARPDPCILVTTDPFPEQFYWDAVRCEVSLENRYANLPDSTTIHSLNKLPKGLIGASAAIAWAPSPDSTWELIAWREVGKILTRREVSEVAIIEMTERFPGTFANRDPTTGRGMIMPRTNCPVLYGVRGESEVEVDDAHRFLQDRYDVEKSASSAIHRTNQVSDDHLLGFRRGVVVSSPFEVQGGHSSVRVWDGESSRTLVAFSESGPVNRLLRRSRRGDEVDWMGLTSPSGEVHLERLRITNSTPRITTRPFCCAKAMRSAGKGQGLRCTVCGSLQEKSWLSENLVLPTEFEGWVEPSPANRRHLARPLARGLPKPANSQD